MIDPDAPLAASDIEAHLGDRWTLEREKELERRKWMVAIFTTIISLAIGLVIIQHLGPAASSATSTTTGTSTMTGESPLTKEDDPLAASSTDRYVCVWEPSGYAASLWEQDWTSHIDEWRLKVCPVLSTQPHRDNSILMTALISHWQTVTGEPVHRQVQSAARRATLVSASAPAVADPHVDDAAGSDIFHSRSLMALSEDLMSAHVYELRCRLSGPSFDPRRRLSQSYYTVARGLELIEPLVGMLRDPMTMCNPEHQTPASTAAIAEAQKLIPEVEPVQSKRVFLPSYAAPWAIDTSGDVVAFQSTVTGAQPLPLPPAALVGAQFRESIAVTIDAISDATRLSPFAHHHSPIPAQDSISLGYIQQANPSVPISSQRLASVAVDSTSKQPTVTWTTVAEPLTEEEVQTAILVDVPRSASAEDESFQMSVSSAMLSRPGNLDWRTRAAPRVLLFDLGARSTT